jgi:hypothetical protein
LFIEDQVSINEHMGGRAGGRGPAPAGTALVRLGHGRFDPDHAPPDVKTEGDPHLNELRRVFLGSRAAHSVR